MSAAPAYLLNGTNASREAFYAAACDPRRSVVVEACAGAGKTWMLVSRILRALLDGAQPHEILAITFTRKAAGEMRARLNDWLKEFAAPACSDERRVAELRARGLSDAQAHALAPALGALHERVLCTGRSVEIRTFHAWFSQLLRAAPLELLAELGLQSDMALIEDVTDHQPEVYRRFHAALLANAPLYADYVALVEQRGRSQVRKWLDAAWDKRVEIELADAAGTLASSVPPAHMHWPAWAVLAHPAERLATLPVHTLLASVARALGAGTGAVGRKQGALLELALAHDDMHLRFAAARAALFTREGTPRKNLKASRLDEALAVLNEIEQAIAQQAAHEEHQRMVGLARLLLAEFAAYKGEHGLADMADLERCALVLLRDSTLSGWMQERLDARIRHVLIDEFQDTSPLQWHALHAWLSAYAGAGGGASGQRPPGVFIVGDPKQSIYRFRRAEPRVFEAARAFIEGALGGSVLACDHTRRNAPQVLAVLNEVFDAAQQRGEFSGFRRHSTEVAALEPAGVWALPRVLRPAKATDAPADETWRNSLTTPRHDAEEVLREHEARQVAQAVHELVATRAVAPGEIQVLSRKRASLRLVAQALAARHVPFAAAEDFALLDSADARDLIAVLDVLASPQHKLSLAQALRSPLFGASDDDLIALAQASAGHGDWWRALFSLESVSPALQRARELLPRWQAAAQRLPPHDLLDLIVAEGEVRERVAAAVPPEQCRAALGTIDALLGQALMLDGARYATPYNFVRALKRRSVKVPAAAQPDAVQLMTIHGAKGLEARVVFVMDSDPQPKTADTAGLLVDWPVELEHPRHCAFVYSETQCPPSLTGVLEREWEARRREELKGLYVAMSRARERLVFSATEPSRTLDAPSWWQRIEPHALPWQPLAGEPRHGDAADPVVSLQVLPAWHDVERAAVAAEPDHVDNDDASRLGQAVHRVLEWACAPGAAAPDLTVLAAAAAHEFAVHETDVARLAGGIWRSPQCARFFSGPAIRWAGNEVPVGEGRDVLRIDRLVALEEAGQCTWWVLDYKLHHTPQHLDAYRDQMQRYRRAVRALQPDDPVRCAFITGSGELVEIDSAD